MMTILGQIIEAGDETNARQIFDVFDTLLITVSFTLSFKGGDSDTISRRHPFFRSMSRSWFSSCSSMPEAKPFRRIFVI